MIQQFNRFAAVAGAGLALTMALAIASPISAEIRRLESVGFVPVNPKTRTRTPLRDRALEVALSEGVSRVAQDLIVSEGSSPDQPETGDGREITPKALRELLGENPVDYTTRFRILEDRGERPTLFEKNARFATEYQVVVEVHVDVDRVRSQLIGAGMLGPLRAMPETSGIRVQVQGLSSYPGYRALRSLLIDRLGISEVTPVEFTSNTIVVELIAEDSDFDLLARLVQAGPPAFEIEPLEPQGSLMKIAVRWEPSAETGDEELAPWTGDFDDPDWREAQDDATGAGTPRGSPATREW